MAVYGIDFGGSYAAIAKLGPTGAPEIISDCEYGNDLLASAVYIARDGSVIVGENAKEAGLEEPKRLLQYFKRWLGCSTVENREHYVVDGTEYDPIELTSIVLAVIVRYAKEAGEDVKDVVLTYPIYFSNAQKHALVQAAKLAGLNVIEMFSEPTAAVINCFGRRFCENLNVLVYDLGGSTFHVTLMHVSQNGENCSVDVLATDGDEFLGGRNWDKELYQLLIDKYIEQYGGFEEEMAEELKAEIRSSVERLKKGLTTKEKGKIKIPYDGENVVLEVTREEFEKATAGYVEQTVGWLDSVLRKAGKTDDDVDTVLCVGGSTRMPMIKNMLAERFGDKVYFADPEKAVAKGAAIIGGKLTKREYVLDPWDGNFEGGGLKIKTSEEILKEHLREKKAELVYDFQENKVRIVYKDEAPINPEAERIVNVVRKVLYEQYKNHLRMEQMHKNIKEISFDTAHAENIVSELTNMIKTQKKIHQMFQSLDCWNEIEEKLR